jgi:hypothetical protein
MDKIPEKNFHKQIRRGQKILWKKFPSVGPIHFSSPIPALPILWWVICKGIDMAEEIKKGDIIFWKRIGLGDLYGAPGIGSEKF